MKAIYAKDIKAMVKKFNLTDDESEYLNDIAEAINKERTEATSRFATFLVLNVRNIGLRNIKR